MKAARRKQSQDQLVKLLMEVHSEPQGGETPWGWEVGGVRSSVVVPQEQVWTEQGWRRTQRGRLTLCC